MSESDGDRDVLSHLPRTRPARRSAKRDGGTTNGAAPTAGPGAKAAAATAEPKAAAAKAKAKASPKPKARAKAKPEAAAKAKPAQARKEPHLAAAPDPGAPSPPPAGWATPEEPREAGAGDLVAAARQAAGSIASRGAGALGKVLGLLPGR